MNYKLVNRHTFQPVPDSKEFWTRAKLCLFLAKLGVIGYYPRSVSVPGTSLRHLEVHLWTR